MKFCSECGALLTWRIPEGDNLPRHVCVRCHTIHYLNPKIVVGCVAEWEGKVLLCRRAIEPRYGRWTLPAGFMENGESTADAAVRETREEACALVETDRFFSLINVPHINQVHLFYRGKLVDGQFAAGVESLETALFSEEDIPWSEIAFRSVVLCLKAYFSDRGKGLFGVHESELRPEATY
jgi:ADP-ribose pyrophosphatase YjhB (NUDIX family)